MPHWGMALALGTNINDVAPADRLKQGYAHLAEAQQRKAAGSAVEQGLVDALAQRYVADPTGDQMVREQAYSNAMAALTRKFPDDLDVATLYADALMNLTPWALWDTRTGEPAPNSRSAEAKEVLERALGRPDASRHPGLLHLYIHLIEMSATPEQAQAVHAYIRGCLAAQDAAVAEKVQLLYGGSVKGTNAAQLFGMRDIDGGLIGGASLDSGEMAMICRAASPAS